MAAAPAALRGCDSPPWQAEGASHTSYGLCRMAQGSPRTTPVVETPTQTHVVHPVHGGAEQEEGVDADALHAVTCQIISIQRLLFGLLGGRGKAQISTDTAQSHSASTSLSPPRCCARRTQQPAGSNLPGTPRDPYRLRGQRALAHQVLHHRLATGLLQVAVVSHGTDHLHHGTLHLQGYGRREAAVGALPAAGCPPQPPRAFLPPAAGNVATAPGHHSGVGACSSPRGQEPHAML